MGLRFFKEIADSREETLELKGYNSSLLEEDTAKIVNRFLARPWFGRRWILQEVALGCDIIVRCGPLKLSWNWFVRSIRILNSHPLTRYPLCTNSVPSVEAITNLDSGSRHILELLFIFHSSECSALRDRIFALYGMATSLLKNVCGC